jgi:two-component system, OmpR family, alkaline phosphatase synthesis response regulator PhoP
MSKGTKNKSKKKKKICIVEDEPSIREIYQVALEKAGYEVITAGDGEEGFNIIASEKPDLALVDIMMPVKDGISLIKDLNADKKLSEIPIIILSNLTEEETIAKQKNLRTEFYLIKSLFAPKAVVGIVKEVLQGSEKRKNPAK